MKGQTLERYPLFVWGHKRSCIKKRLMDQVGDIGSARSKRVGDEASKVCGDVEWKVVICQPLGCSCSYPLAHATCKLEDERPHAYAYIIFFSGFAKLQKWLILLKFCDATLPSTSNCPKLRSTFTPTVERRYAGLAVAVYTKCSDLTPHWMPPLAPCTYVPP
jgi:hypothetical protein